MPEFNLRPFGIALTLTPKTKFADLTLTLLSKKAEHKKSFFGGSTSIVLDGVPYKVIKVAGEGSYGKVFRVEDAKGRTYAIKQITDKLYNGRDVQVFLKECIIQILMAEESKKQPGGPYVPTLFELAYDTDSHHAYIRSEWLRNSLEHLIEANNRQQNNILVPDAVRQVMRLLQFFGERLQFNHRDLKGDNIMYVKDGSNRIFKLIDFGMSCLTWNGLTIHGGTYFKESKPCFRQHRDASQFVYYLFIKFQDQLSSALKNALAQTIVANVGNHKCAMAQDCPANGLTSWRTVYDFLNRGNVTVPAGTPKEIETAMSRFQRTSLCSTRKEWNEQTRRCVTRKAKKNKRKD